MVGDEIYGRRNIASSGLFSTKISSKRVYFEVLRPCSQNPVEIFGLKIYSLFDIKGQRLFIRFMRNLDNTHKLSR
jgi:hypothetical protein